AGAGAPALGLPTVAAAATSTVAGISQADTGANVTDTLDISNIGMTGVSSTNNPAVAVVDTVASGQVLQAGVATGAGQPNGNVNLVTAGVVAVAATASAQGTGVGGCTISAPQGQFAGQACAVATAAIQLAIADNNVGQFVSNSGAIHVTASGLANGPAGASAI